MPCVCVCVCAHVLCSVIADSLRPRRLLPPGFHCPWNFPGKNIGVSSHFLFQGIFPV